MSQIETYETLQPGVHSAAIKWPGWFPNGGPHSILCVFQTLAYVSKLLALL